MSILDSYTATNKPISEIAAMAGLSVADLYPLDTALPGDDVQLPEHVEAALAPVLGTRKPKPGKRHIPLIGRRGSGSPIQYGAISETVVKALMGGRMRTVPELAKALRGVNKAGTRETVCKALRRLETHGITTEIGGDAPRRWALTPEGEDAGKMLEKSK